MTAMKATMAVSESRILKATHHALQDRLLRLRTWRLTGAGNLAVQLDALIAGCESEIQAIEAQLDGLESGAGDA